jgi:hypothetical protein
MSTQPDDLQLALVNPPEILWRVEHAATPLRFSRISTADAALDRGGNRFDVLGSGVLYAATNPDEAFAEALASFRPSPGITAGLLGAAAHQRPRGVATIPRAWRLGRRLRAIALTRTLPFVDIDSPDSQAYLALHAAPLLASLGVTTLSPAIVGGPNRRLTRMLASWLFTQSDASGHPMYSGVRYGSQLGDYHSWAIFEGNTLALMDEVTISRRNADLNALARDFRLEIE